MQSSGFSSDLMHVERAWSDAAVQLLKEQYGIEGRHIAMEWGVCYKVLGTPGPHTRGNLIVVASEATGWCGIVALFIAPPLKNRYYLGFSLFLVLYGLLQDWWVATYWNNPVTSGMIHLHAVLVELKEARIDKGKENRSGLASDDDGPEL